MGFAHVAIKGFEIECHLAEMFGFKPCNFKIKSDQTIQSPIEKEQVYGEIPAPT